MTRLFDHLHIDLGAWPPRHPAEAMLLARAAAQPAPAAAASDWPLGWTPRKPSVRTQTHKPGAAPVR